MTALDILTELDQLGATLDIHPTDRTRTVITAPLGSVDADLLARVRAQRPLMLAAVIGRRSGHVFAACTICGEVSMIRASWQRAKAIASGPKTEWPACRMTPACAGRHVPSATELNLVTQRKQPTFPRPPAKVGKARFLGPRVPWPERDDDAGGRGVRISTVSRRFSTHSQVYARERELGAES